MAEATIAHTARTVTFPNAPAPLPAITRILSRYERQQLAGFIEVAIGLLDVMDGDPDLEGEWSEDEFSSAPSWVSLRKGPGCSISDPGGAAEREDNEEDDPAGQCDEDGINTTMALRYGAGPGCIISDNDFEHDGQEPDYAGV